MDPEEDPRQESTHSRPASKRPPFVRRVLDLRGVFVKMLEEDNRRIAAAQAKAAAHRREATPPAPSSPSQSPSTPQPVPAPPQSTPDSAQSPRLDANGVGNESPTLHGIPADSRTGAIHQRAVSGTAGVGEVAMGNPHTANAVGIPAGTESGGAGDPGSRSSAVIECKETRTIIIPGIEGMITAVRIRVDTSRVYQEFRDDRDFLEATTSKTSLSVEGAAVPVVVNSPVEAVMPLTCRKTSVSVIDREGVTNGLVHKMGIDGGVGRGKDRSISQINFGEVSSLSGPL
ncbi:hypothetical protein GNI_080170 [Gregarina niphandrodes]|uniref:Uncharacterized protein n=1 Tax=Gregarina niphandrodes TaxID=110365 RepID=A0A023B6F9_GRENI|nr:hypothetical protein GNI_080170 [Gregarina niphandrodes]EZG66520.1 hypothetical protein GNI_080170 [Gregarina niphandrodes]|eukprot:XP_011130626.1 hypothetical protein GNI_080170 [Gregarina niphandrodes]